MTDRNVSQLLRATAPGKRYRLPQRTPIAHSLRRRDRRGVRDEHVELQGYCARRRRDRRVADRRRAHQRNVGYPGDQHRASASVGHRFARRRVAIFETRTAGCLRTFDHGRHADRTPGRRHEIGGSGQVAALPLLPGKPRVDPRWDTNAPRSRGVRVAIRAAHVAAPPRHDPPARVRRGCATAEGCIRNV